MIILRIFSEDATSTLLKRIFHGVYDLDEYLIDYPDSFRIVDDDSYTHAILINTVMPSLSISKENVIGWAIEPNAYLKLTDRFISYASKHISKYFIGIKNDLPDPFIEHYSFMWHEWKNRVQPLDYEEKKHAMSIIISHKDELPGHKYRHTLVQWILSTDLDIHIYGNGSSRYGNDSRIKGSFEGEAPLTPLHDYKYTIAIENSTSATYVSEKFTSPIMYNTIPIYLGASKIMELFGNDCCYQLTGCLENDKNIITDVCLNLEERRLPLMDAHYQLTEGNCYFPSFFIQHFVK